MGMSTSLNVLQFYIYSGPEKSVDVISRLVKELGGKQELEFPEYVNDKQSPYIETGITINGFEIIASNNPYDDASMYVEDNEIIFYVANWSPGLTIDIVNQHYKALQELENRIKGIDPSLITKDIEVFASYS